MCLGALLLLQCRSSLCLHPENVHSLWGFYRESQLLRRSLLVCRMQVEYVPSSLCEWNQMSLVNSTNSIVACRFFTSKPSRILRRVDICEVVDLFLGKTVWVFLRMLSILGSMLFCNRALYILAAMDVSVIPRLFLANPRSPFLGKGRMHPFIHLSIGF